MRRRQLGLYKRVLLRRLEELDSAIAAKRKHGRRGFETPETDPFDQSTQSYSKEQLFSSCERDRAMLDLVKQALRKIVQDQYGFCEACGGPINEKRLSALPWVKYCVKCQNASEQDQAVAKAAV